VASTGPDRLAHAKLGSVPLRLSLRPKHAIGEVGQVNPIGLPSGQRLAQEKEASSLEWHVVVGVLREWSRRQRTLLAEAP
jgi:hypothetical protein